MKFFFAIAAAAASLAFAAESGNLRATAAVENPVAKSVEARIQMGGLLHEPTKEELAVLDQTVLDTYNKVYNKLGKEAGSVDSKAAFINDEGVGSVVSFWMDWLTGECGPFCGDYWDDWECYTFGTGCPLMELMSEEEQNIVKTGSFHAKFEKQLCKKLQASGVTNFAQVHDCSISFVEDMYNPTKEAKEVQAAKEAELAKSAASVVTSH